jgi:WD40 repeat protein
MQKDGIVSQKQFWLLVMAATLSGTKPTPAQTLVEPAWKTFRGQVDRIALSPDGKMLAGVGGGLREGIVLWDCKSGKEVARLGKGPYKDSLLFTPTGRLLLTSYPNVRKPGDDRLPVVTFRVWDVKSRALRRSIDLPRGQGWGEAAVVDDRTLVVPGGEDVVALYDLRTGKCVGTIKGKHRPRLLAVSANGKWLLTAGSDRFGWAVPPAAVGAPRTPIPPDRLYVWDLARRKVLHELYEHTQPVASIAISADGRWCASSTKRDRRLWIFDRLSGAIRARTQSLFLGGAEGGLVFANGGQTLVAGGPGPADRQLSDGLPVATGWGPHEGLLVWDWQASGDPRYYPLRSRRSPRGDDDKWCSSTWFLALAGDGRTLFTLGEGHLPEGRRQLIRIWDVLPPAVKDPRPPRK